MPGVVSRRTGGGDRMGGDDRMGGGGEIVELSGSGLSRMKRSAVRRCYEQSRCARMHTHTHTHTHHKVIECIKYYCI